MSVIELIDNNIKDGVLHLAGVNKSFSGNQVLFDLDLDVSRGEVHALVGHNGSGKSTLVKILAGYHRPEEVAQASSLGQTFKLGVPGASHIAGIRFVHQDLGLVSTISVVDNLALGSGFETKRSGRINWKNEIRSARSALASLGFEIDVEAQVSTLTLAERTGVAIARTLRQQENVNLLVFDEPTAALPLGEVSRLFGLIRRLRDRNIGILLITHNLEEVLDISDRVSILRNGRRIATVSCEQIDRGQLVKWIVGKEILSKEHAPTVANILHKQSLLEVKEMSGGNVVDFTLSVNSGEIVGITGLSGSGRESVASLLAGRIERKGTVEINGTKVRGGNPRAAKKGKLALVPGDRLRYGLVASMNLRENLTLGDLKPHTRFGRTSSTSERRESSAWINRLGVVTSGTDAIMTTLSGGNQQKVLFARALRLSPKLLVLDDPTAGIDIGAKTEVHTIIKNTALAGAAIILASTDTDELVYLCDRIVIMRDGRVARVISRWEGL